MLFVETCRKEDASMEKVLLILESDAMQKALKDSLASFDIRACKSDEAAEVLAQFRPDALVLDLFLHKSKYQIFRFDKQELMH